MLNDEQRLFIKSQRVTHLATADARNVPHVVPVCFALHSDKVFSAIDDKPKAAGAKRIKRVRNILANPNVTAVVDRYDDNWSRHGWIML